MLDEPPRVPNLSEAQHRELKEIEQHLRATDPVLEYSLSAVRSPSATTDLIAAGVIALIAAPLILLATLLLGVGAGALLAVLALIIALVRARRSKRSHHAAIAQIPRQPS